MKLRGLHPDVRAAAQFLLDWAEHLGFSVTVTSGYRSLQDQARLRRRFDWCVESGRWKDGVTEGCQFPANQPGDSAHNFGLAWDSVVEPEFQGWWNWMRRHIGFRVPDHDEIHAEVPGWRSLVRR